MVTISHCHCEGHGFESRIVRQVIWYYLAIDNANNVLKKTDIAMHLVISGNGVVAQLAERYLCKVKDEGSNPFCSTNKKLGYSSNGENAT